MLRDATRAAQVAAIARTVLFRRVRSVLVRPHEHGPVATTLKFDYEIRPSDETASASCHQARVDKEMLDLALHIINTRRAGFSRDIRRPV